MDREAVVTAAAERMPAVEEKTMAEEAVAVTVAVMTAVEAMVVAAEAEAVAVVEEEVRRKRQKPQPLKKQVRHQILTRAVGVREAWDADHDVTSSVSSKIVPQVHVLMVSVFASDAQRVPSGNSQAGGDGWE